MARRQSKTLTEAEQRVMEVLWEEGAATVAMVEEALRPRVSLAYTTILTTLRILEQKGYVNHTKKGRAHLYHPCVERGDARRRALKDLLSRFFNDSPELLVLNLLKDEEISEDDLTEIRRIIEEGETP